MERKGYIMAKGLNIDSLKRINRGLVFQLLATQESCSRIDLAKSSKLTKMAISNIINEFLETGLVTEYSEIGRGTRSNPIQLALAPTAPKVLGVLIHRRSCEATVCDFSMKIVASKAIALPKYYTADELMDYVFVMTDELVTKYQDIVGIGIGSIGPVDALRGMILNPPHFNRIQNLNIRDRFITHYSLPTFLDHHYNCAALAESYYGNGKGCGNLMYLGMTYGVGLGAICGGKLFSSHNGYSSEIGHVTIDCNGPVCGCGKRGCLSLYARPPKIVQEVANSPLIGREMSFQEICDSSDQPAIDQIIMNYMITPLVYALSSAINLMNSDLILLGDDAALLPDRYLGYLEQRLNEIIFTHDYHHVSVRRAMLPKEYNAAMCASTVIDQVFRGKLLF